MSRLPQTEKVFHLATFITREESNSGPKPKKKRNRKPKQNKVSRPTKKKCLIWIPAASGPQTMRIGPKSWWLDGGQKKTLAEIDKFATANEMLDSATTAKFVIYDNVYVIRQPKQFPQPQRSLAKNQKAIPYANGRSFIVIPGKRKLSDGKWGKLIPPQRLSVLSGGKVRTPCGCYGLQQWLLNRFKWPAICLNVVT